MSTTADAHDTSGTSPGQDFRVPADAQDGSADTAGTRPRRLLDRISEAVRAAHKASVPF